VSRLLAISGLCRFLLGIFLLGIFLLASPASSASEGISDIVITQGNNKLVVSAQYKGGFTREIQKEIINGVSREFFYYIVLMKVMPNWLDEEKASKTIKYTVKYDILKNQFLVTKSAGEIKEEQIFDSYDEMVLWVSKIEKITLAPLKLLGKRDKYYVNIKAEMKGGELPFLLRYLLFFIPYSKLSTEWSHSRVFMLKDFK
jgi:hypothetical protein